MAKSALARFSPSNRNVSTRFRHHATKSDYWDGKRKKIVLGLVMPFLIIQLLFLGLQSYIFGSGHGSENRVHNLHVLAVDYDGGVVGDSLRAAYDLLESPQMLGLRWEDTSRYPTPDLLYDAVYHGRKWWAAIWVPAGASARLNAAIANNNTAQSYDPKRALVSVYNQARYPDFADAYILSNLETLGSVTRLAYNEIAGVKALTTIPKDDTASLSVVLSPIDITIENIKPLDNGDQVFYNTVGQVFTILMQFFFLMAFNIVLGQWSLDSRLPVKQQILLRIFFSIAYTFIGSLSVAANIYAMRGPTHFTGVQFVLLWMVFWLELHILFLVLETATTFLQMPFLPMFIVTFIILNVTSTIYPFALSPGFYKWGWALPCHNVYQIEIQIMSGGAHNLLDISLPILFAWEVVGIPAAYFAVVWRCNKAAEADKELAALIQADIEQSSDSADTEEGKKRRRELVYHAMRDAREATLGTFGLGFPTLWRSRAKQREDHAAIEENEMEENTMEDEAT